MKNYLIVGLFFVLYSCNTESDVGPAQATTFVHYFNGGNSDEAKQVIKVTDGYIILANTAIKVSELADPVYKIKLIKTDEFGNQLWQQFFPAFNPNKPIESTDTSYRANNIAALYSEIDPTKNQVTGLVIAGEDLKNGSPQMMVLKIELDDLGNVKGKIHHTLKSTSPLSGQAVSLNKDGDFIVLGSITNSASGKNMILTKFSKTKLDSVWSYEYGAGQSTLAPRLFVNDQNDAFWGGTIQKDNTNSSVRFVSVLADPSNLGGINFDLPISSPQYIETGNDFCRYGSGFAVIGSTNQTGDTDIMFKRISDNGQTLSTSSFPIEGQQQNETGNSIYSTRDGGLILLGTIDTQGDIGRGDKDYYLIKIDAFGAVEWTKDYGSKFEDNGVNVIQAEDGGYIVLGTSNIGRVKTIMLMKTDKNGKIE